MGSLALEVRPILASGALALVAAQPLKFAAAAAMGFGVNSLAYIVIQTASSLTLKVLGTVKSAFVVWLGIVLLGERMTPLQGGGYAISIGAFYWYQKIKMEQIRATGGAGSVPTTPLRRGGSLGLGSGKFDMVKEAVASLTGTPRTPKAETKEEV